MGTLSSNCFPSSPGPPLSGPPRGVWQMSRGLETCVLWWCICWCASSVIIILNFLPVCVVGCTKHRLCRSGKGSLRSTTARIVRAKHWQWLRLPVGTLMLVLCWMSFSPWKEHKPYLDLFRVWICCLICTNVLLVNCHEAGLITNVQ